VVASTARVLSDFLVGLECQEENRPFSQQQHQAQFGLNPALVFVNTQPTVIRFRTHERFATMTRLKNNRSTALKVTNQIIFMKKTHKQRVVFKLSRPGTLWSTGDGVRSLPCPRLCPAYNALVAGACNHPQRRLILFSALSVCG